MPNFTIEELEALKEGTTSGPWGHTSLGYEAEKYPVYGDVPGDEVALVRRQDWELVSAAPDLVDALIATEAKLQQLMGQIEGLADWHDTKAMKARDFPWPGEQHAARFRGKAETHETARDKLTEILEENND